MTQDATTLSPSPNHYAEFDLLRREIEAITQQLDELHSDLRFIKDIFLAKQAKKERRRQKKEQERLEIERAKKAEKVRERYECIIWRLVGWPWDVMPAPTSKLSPKELEMVRLMAQLKTDAEIAAQMGIKENSIRPRICAANQKLGSNSREELVAYYLDYKKVIHHHRHRRCLTLLSWLLNPPPGFIRRRDLKLSWMRVLERGRKCYYAVPYIPIEMFDSLKPHEHGVLKLKTSGFTNAEIAERLKIKETTVRSYVAGIRAGNKWVTGNTIKSEQALICLYKKYQNLERRRKREK